MTAIVGARFCLIGSIEKRLTAACEGHGLAQLPKWRSFGDVSQKQNASSLNVLAFRRSSRAAHNGLHHAGAHLPLSGCANRPTRLSTSRGVRVAKQDGAVPVETDTWIQSDGQGNVRIRSTRPCSSSAGRQHLSG